MQRRQRRRRPSAQWCAGFAAALSAVVGVVPRATVAGVAAPLRRVLVTGAVHGNELTGAWVVQRLQRQPAIAARPSVESVETILGNPQAYRVMRRFVDVDLNRQFAAADLADIHLAGYETQRAKVLDARYGPKAVPSRAVDLVIDLHTTTTTMGITFIVERWSIIGQPGEGGLPSPCVARARGPHN